MKKFYGIGVMTGTSMDALDLAYCRFDITGEDQYNFSLEASAAIPMDPQWKARLLYLPQQSAEVFAKTHVYFGHWLGKAIREFIEKENLKPDFVAAHGQTIFHRPHKNYTVQIGDGESLVAHLPCPLVTNFRNKDVTMGGRRGTFSSHGRKISPA